MRPSPEQSLQHMATCQWMKKPYSCFLCDHDSKRYCLSGESTGTAKFMRASWKHMAEIIWRIITSRPEKILPCFAWLNRRVLQKHVLCCMKWRVYLAVSTLGSCIHLWNKLFLQMDMISINTVQSNLWHICCRLCKCGLMCWLYRASHWFLQDEYSKCW